MHIHIQTQLCGLAIMATLLYLFLRQKRVGLYTERVFIRTILISMVSLTLDFISVIAITNMEEIPRLLLLIICKSYISSVVVVGYLAYTYIITDLYNEQDYLRHLKYATAVVALQAVVIFCLPISFFNEGYIIYTYGPSVAITYVFALSFVISTFYMMLRYKAQIEAKRRLAVMTWMVFWFLAAVVQFFNNECLLVGFAAALGLLTLYCTLENPENSVDHKFGCFHQHVFVDYMNQCFGRKESKSVMFISFQIDRRDNVTNQGYIEQCMHCLVSWLDKNTKAKVFHSVEQELVVIFPSMTDMTAAFSSMQEIFYFDHFYRDSKKKKYAKENHNLEFPASVFILFPDSCLAKNTEEIMAVRKILLAEYNNVTSSVVCYVNDTTLLDVRKKSAVISEIKDALAEDRVEIYLQPIYSMSEKRFVSAEVLARIRRKDGTIMSPGSFIPIAEKNGLIGKLGERVFQKTCAFLKEHHPDEIGIHYLEVNLSVVQCEQRNLADHFMYIMQEYGIEPFWINLEITETGSFQSKQTLMDNMNRLISQGVSFSLDDFGNGQSNLDYMIDMPVSVMKLDMNMSQAYFSDLKAKVVVQSIIRLAHELDLFVVAEGIETAEQLQEMERLGVDYIQGYYFSRPLSIKSYLDFLQA